MSFRSSLSAAFVVACAMTGPARAQGYDLANELPVVAANRSEGVLCAEKDNIFVPFTASAVRSFRIQAVHPAYVGLIQTDRWAPDWTSCDMSNDPSFGSGDATKRVTLYETPDLQVVGYIFPNFWRPAETPVTVAGKTTQGLHLVQVWTRHRERAEESLVLYPPDGYWRARPLPFADLRYAAYGSSFLIGPVEVQGRPIVALKAVSFDPATKTFTLDFARGGSARATISALDQNHLALDVAMSGPTPEGLPFAALRSMYVTEFNSDVARFAWREKNGAAWRESTAMEFPGGSVTEFWAGRLTPSRHNTSAPDMVFSRFKAD
jgi:hypothetical protein